MDISLLWKKVFKILICHGNGYNLNTRLINTSIKSSDRDILIYLERVHNHACVYFIGAYYIL